MGKWKGPLHEDIPRCGAKTRTGGRCGHYSMPNGRCRYHGGKSTGARNPHRPLKHSRYTKEAIQERKEFAEFVKDAKSLVGEAVERS